MSRHGESGILGCSFFFPLLFLSAFETRTKQTKQAAARQLAACTLVDERGPIDAAETMKMLALVVLAVGYFIAAASAAAAVGKKALPAEDGTATHVRKKVRLHQVAHNQLYGVDLPAFAFDYSELLASAVIERSENLRDLYLTIFLLGHQAIFQNGYISALQTDQDNVLAWRQAAQQWQRDRQHNQTSHSRSRLFCVLHHNDHPRAQAYQVPAYWLSAQASVVNAGLEVLRCKLRNPSTIFSNYTHQSSKRLFVDLIRRNPAESVVSSFSIPWRERSIGYGSLAVRSPALSLWSFTQPNRSEGDLRPLSANRLARHSKHPRGSGGSGGLRGENMNSNSSSSGGGAGGGPVQPILHACVPGVRPVQARPQVPIASLMEFLGHLQVLNVSHTTLGLVVDGQEKSYFMAKHVYALSAAIASGQVSLSALSWPQYDDVPGFLGVMLSTSLADSLFLNHCFSLSRGKADYVLVLRPFQFWLPAGFTARQLGQETERWTWLQFFQQSRTRPMEAGAGIGAGRYTSRYLDSHSANRSVTMTTSPPASLAGHNSSHSRQALSCSLVLTERFAVEDPSNALFPPGDSTWIQGKTVLR